MPSPVPVYEAVEWREPAPTGGSKAQVFRLADGRYALVKFPENDQGEMVLANEFLCCRLARSLRLPINDALLVAIDERTLRLPRQNGQIHASFSAGIRCGMVRYEDSEAVQAADGDCHNSAELHHIAVFEQLMARGDGRQLLQYSAEEDGKKLKFFAAIDYGYAFGGSPLWTADSVRILASPVLPLASPFDGHAYANGDPQEGIIERLRTLGGEQVLQVFQELHAPRWGVTGEALAAAAEVVHARARELVRQFDERHRPQTEAFHV